MTANQKEQRRKVLPGLAAILGGVLGLVLAPIMVVIKYMTGWSIIPAPRWVEFMEPAMGKMLSFASPPELWTVYGIGYTVALVLMFVGLIYLSREIRDDTGRLKSKGYWLLVAGFAMVIPGDAIHSLTWHQNGLTVPTPGTNPLANTAYAVHMMGMNFVIVGAMIVGVSALRKKFLAPWFAWMFVLILPSAVLASVTLLPTTPSGALWLYCLTMITFGYTLVTGRSLRPVGVATNSTVHLHSTSNS